MHTLTRPSDYDDFWRDAATVAFVPLTRGKFAVVDLADLPTLSRYRWFVRLSGTRPYAAGRIRGRASWSSVYMHRIILRPKLNQVTDHIDHNPLNNRRRNLRPATPSQNAANKATKSRSGFRGVCKAGRGFVAQISSDKGTVCIGCFQDPEAAAAAYDIAALGRFGDFAVLNFPDRKAEYLSRLNAAV